MSNLLPIFVITKKITSMTIQELLEDLEYFIPKLVKNPKSKRRRVIRRLLQYYTDTLYADGISLLDFNLLSEKGLDYTNTSERLIIKKIGGEKNQSKVMREHNLPIGQIINILMDTPKENFREVIETKLKTYWVTREENNKLNKSGYSRIRPENGYELCGIILVD
jgi:hypothetical protein